MTGAAAAEGARASQKKRAASLRGWGRGARRGPELPFVGALGDAGGQEQDAADRVVFQRHDETNHPTGPLGSPPADGLVDAGPPTERRARAADAQRLAQIT